HGIFDVPLPGGVLRQLRGRDFLPLISAFLKNSIFWAARSCLANGLILYCKQKFYWLCLAKNGFLSLTPETCAGRWWQKCRFGAFQNRYSFKAPHPQNSRL